MRLVENLENFSNLILDAEVIVIGNGPAGLSLSTFLSGWHPFYDSQNSHPDKIIHGHFMENLENSLIDQELSWFQDECLERINPSVGAFPCLYDTLVRPTSNESQKNFSLLKWHLFKERAVSHIVLGEGNIGGSWNNYDDRMVAVSLANWMDLPGFSISEWLGANNSELGRLPASLIRQYMVEYARRMDITNNIWSFTKVTNIAKFCHEPTGEEYWEVKGVSINDGHIFCLKTRNVVLACGKNHPRTLDVFGETSESRMVYNVSDMKQLLLTDSDRQEKELMENFFQEKDLSPKNPPVIVVGDGISAADCVLHCLKNDIPVLQLIRRNEKQLRNVMISRLSSYIYPEYARIFRLMIGHEKDPNYRSLTSSRVLRLKENNERIILLETPFGVINEEFNCIVACVGRRSELGMLEDKYEFSVNYQSTTDNSLFAIGSVAGDHFVRYLIGGALQVAQTIIKQNNILLKYKKRQQILLQNSIIIQIDGSNFEHKKCNLTKNRTIPNCIDIDKPHTSENLAPSATNNYLLKKCQQQPKQCIFQQFCYRFGRPLRCRTRAHSVTS